MGGGGGGGESGRQRITSTPVVSSSLGDSRRSRTWVRGRVCSRCPRGRGPQTGPCSPSPGRSRTSVGGADGAALARGNCGTGTVLGVVADHVIAQHVAIVADTDPTRLGFPDVSVLVPEAVLYAGDWWDWRKRGGVGAVSGAGAPTSGLQGPLSDLTLCLRDTLRFSIFHRLLPPPQILRSSSAPHQRQ